LKHRLFTAFRPPLQNIGEIITFQKKLISLNFPITWEPPEKIHLTLNYLGRLTDEQAFTAKKMLGETIRGTTPFELRPLFLETLYKRHEQSIIYLSVGGDTEALEEFQETLSGKFRRIDIPQPEKYSAHITLGRMQRTDPVTTKAFLDKLDDIEAPVFLPFTPEEVICYKSLVSKTGSTYQVYTRFPY